MNYKDLLSNSSAIALVHHDQCSIDSFLANYIFGVDTYESEIDSFMCQKAVEVAEAITNGTTYEYIKNDEDRKWYMVMCHLPFFAKRIEWGCSIRGAWWVSGKELNIDTCGLWDENGEQIETLCFENREEFKKFMEAVIVFHKTQGFTRLPVIGELCAVDSFHFVREIQSSMSEYTQGKLK